MKTGLLFDVPPTKPSVRVRLTEFKARHNILTHHAKHLTAAEDPWLALIPVGRDRDKSIGRIMAESCVDYERTGRCATGRGEKTAVLRLCQQMGIECDL